MSCGNVRRLTISWMVPSHLGLITGHDGKPTPNTTRAHLKAPMIDAVALIWTMPMRLTDRP